MANKKTNGKMNGQAHKRIGRAAAARRRHKALGANGSGLPRPSTVTRLGRRAQLHSPFTLLETQHREILSLCQQLGSANRRTRQRVFDQLFVVLALHFELEERLFYPALMARRTEELLLKSVEEHLSVKRILADLCDIDATEATFRAKCEVLFTQVEEHIREEEKRTFVEARKLLDGMRQQELLDQMEQLEQELRGAARELRPLIVEHLADAARI